MKILVLGASGIIGQHMRLELPPSVQPTWHRQEADDLHVGCGLADEAELRAVLAVSPCDMVINLAGQSDTDAVERDPEAAYAVNVEAVRIIAEHCAKHSKPLIQVSTQGVFSGEEPPYGPTSLVGPVNEYGRQKAEAEQIALGFGAMVVRPTFVLGVRPMPHWGRSNPIEQMYGGQRKQVNDRWFSVLYAGDAARLLWGAAIYTFEAGKVLHLGTPRRTNRQEIAHDGLGLPTEPVSHDSFKGIAPRPHDTTYADEATAYSVGLGETITRSVSDYRSRNSMDALDRAREIAIFLGKREEHCLERMQRGFGVAHQEVTLDFWEINPKTDDELLEWYRKTEAYIWELSAYHCDPGFNYVGMCRGITERLKAADARRVLCLGDGIGDVTLALRRAGMDAVYHDLKFSRTADFGMFRLWRHTGRVGETSLTSGWAPAISGPFDAVVSVDFLEHVTDVAAWATAIRNALKPGGLFVAQNAFGLGSGVGGSMPMHLERNSHYEKEWDPLLANLGFNQQSSNWYQRAA